MGSSRRPGRAVKLSASPPWAIRSAITPLLGASTISNVGTGAHFVAIAWFVLTLTGSASRVGGVSAAGMFGLALGSAIGGLAADRLGPRPCSIGFDVLAAIPVAMIPLLYLTGVLTYWQILACAFVGGVLDMPGSTARQVMLPTIARESRVAIDQANALMQLATNGAFMLLGPLAAAALIPAIGAAAVLFLDAGTYLASALVIAVAIPRLWSSNANATQYSGGETSTQPSGGSFREAIGYIASQARLLVVLIAAGALGFLVSGVVTVIVPALSKDRFESAAALSAMIWCFGLGLIGGFGGIAVLRRRLDRDMVIRLACIAIAGALWLLWLARLLAVDALALFVVGLGLGLVIPLAYSVVTLRTPARLLGRVIGSGTAAVFLAAPVGSIAAGLALAWLSLPIVQAIGASLMSAVGIWVIVDRRFRELH